MSSIIGYRSVFNTIFVLFLSLYAVTANADIAIVAAENTYGEVAKEIGGSYVTVMSILNNPSQDPHLFTITPSTAKAISHADIVINNGADYDPWILPMLATQGRKDRKVINVAALMHIKSGDNPHIWYMPETMPIFAKTLVDELTQLDPAHQDYYKNQLTKFNQSYQTIFATIARLKQRYQHQPVIATEPVFGYMAKSIGLDMHSEAFQINVMNDVPPTVSQIKSFEDDLSHHSVVLLIYNKQVINPLTAHMKRIAKENHIPVFGVSEMLPSNISFVQWIVSELHELDKALANVKKASHG
jgi:zinc/manganese transport system substrate-binding protein